MKLSLRLFICFPLQATLAVCLAACFVLSPVQSQALIELRGAYTHLTPDPEELGRTFPSHPTLSKMASIGGDLIFTLAGLPVGLGARYEAFRANDTFEDQASIQREVAWNRISVLINRRLIDSRFFVGPLVTLGVSNSFAYKTESDGQKTEYKSRGNLSGSAGIEAGWRLSVFTLGAEAGYIYAPLGELRNGTGAPIVNSDGGPVHVDLGGTYLRAMIGLDI